MTNRRWVAVIVALLAVTAGCSGAGGGDSGDGQLLGADGEQATGAPGADGDRDGDAGGIDDYNAQQFANRELILTGQVAIEVDDFEAARANLTEATEGYGGFVSDTRQEVNRRDNETWTTGLVVLRVPRENFSVLFERAKAEGELLEAHQESEDVTDQLVDIQARLENLRAERDQLREIYQRANETEDVLKVQEQLSDVQEEIERLEARQQSLRERVALSTITVRMVEPRPGPAALDQWYDVPLVVAFLESVDGVLTTLRAIAVAAAYAAPYLVVFGLPLAAAGYAVRRRGGRPPGGGRRWLPGRGGDDTGDRPEGEDSDGAAWSDATEAEEPEEGRARDDRSDGS